MPLIRVPRQMMGHKGGLQSCVPSGIHFPSPPPLPSFGFLASTDSAGGSGAFSKMRSKVKLQGARNSNTVPPKQSTELNIVQLQRADGSWELKPELAKALSCKLPEIEAAKPKDASNPQWATVLALVWLHGQAADSQDEWGLLAKKAYNWLKKQGMDIVNWVAEANKLLNTSVDHKDLQ
uniref:Uncharacterized protein n=1 Tax=Eptatretus burgeri TaxID=7764 RepID=A0A8C4WW02_EPTBU